MKETSPASQTCSIFTTNPVARDMLLFAIVCALAAVLIALFAPSAFAQGNTDILWSKRKLEVPDRGTVTVRVVRFAYDVTAKEVIDEMRRHRTRPAYDEHCRAYAKSNRGLFVCFGSVKVEDGVKLVRVVFSNRGLEGNEFVHVEGLWIPIFTFLAVPDVFDKKRP